MPRPSFRPGRPPPPRRARLWRAAAAVLGLALLALSAPAAAYSRLEPSGGDLPADTTTTGEIAVERHPVVRLSFGGGNFKEPANLDASVMAQLEGVAEQEGVSARYATAPERLNNLTDLTLDPVYSSICGYTEADLDTVFAPELGGLDREQAREWRLVRTRSASG